MNERESKEIKNVVEKTGGLNREMKSRHIVMIGLGGTIGTGLFLGTGYVLKEAGPGGTIIAYLIGGLVMYLMMLCLGELVAAMPVSGNTQAYATEFVNPAMGFTVGWVNWLGCAVTITSQIVASAIIMKNIFPSVNNTVWIVLFTVLLFATNALTTKKYGESSFWFSSLKIVLIVAFSIIGIGMMLGLGNGKAVGFSNYTNDGGLFPNGFKPILMTLMTAIFAYGGSDLFANAAGESENPQRDIPKVINLTSWSLIISYSISLIILAAVLPWRNADLLGSPFAYVFKLAGFKSAELIVNIIVLTSALSSANYFVYGCTRTLWSLGKYGQAPKFLAKVTKNKVPMNSLIVTMVFAALSIVASFVAADTVYLFLISIVGAGNIFIYGLDCICQYRFRKRYIGNGGKLEDLNFRTPLFPLVPILGVAAYGFVFVGMCLDVSQRMSLILSVIVYTSIYFIYNAHLKKADNLKQFK